MSTVVYCRGAMVADTQAYLGPKRPAHAKMSKLCRLPCGGMAGAATSEVGLVELLLDWAAKGCDPHSHSIPINSSFELLVVEGGPNGGLKLFYNSPYPVKLTADYMAIGSGSAYALGALSQGCGAQDAVLAAAKFDQFTNATIECLIIFASKG
jgi:hypothetical protein